MTVQEMKDLLIKKHNTNVRSVLSQLADYETLIDRVYEETPDKWLQPGVYEIYEVDFYGMRDEPKFHIKLENGMNQKELALKLMLDRDYVNPFGNLQVREYEPDYTIS